MVVDLFHEKTLCERTVWPVYLSHTVHLKQKL